MLCLPLTAVAADQARVGGNAVGARTRIAPPHPEWGYGLARAVFRYPSGEHLVQRIGHLLGRDVSHDWFSGETPAQYRYDAIHQILPLGSDVHVVNQVNCEGVCELGLPTPPDDHLLVLAGFLFESVDGTEHPISTIAIEPSGNSIVVEFSDGTDFPYDATVQYAYVPTDVVHGGAVLTASKSSSISFGRPGASFPFSQLPAGESFNMYNGFRVAFQDGQPRPLQELTLTIGGISAAIWFCDAGRDDVFDATVHIVPGAF